MLFSCQHCIPTRQRKGIIVGQKITQGEVCILHALPEEIALRDVPTRVLGEALIAQSKYAGSKIYGKFKKDERAAVFVASDAEGELISMWDPHNKEIPFDSVHIAEKVKKDFLRSYLDKTDFWQSWIVMSFILWVCIFILIYSVPNLNEGWSEFSKYWGGFTMLCVVIVPVSIVVLIVQTFWVNYRAGFEWGKDSHHKQVDSFLQGQKAQPAKPVKVLPKTSRWWHFKWLKLW